jgi:hypothetical protein
MIKLLTEPLTTSITITIQPTAITVITKTSHCNCQLLLLPKLSNLTPWLPPSTTTTKLMMQMMPMMTTWARISQALLLLMMMTTTTNMTQAAWLSYQQPAAAAAAAAVSRCGREPACPHSTWSRVTWQNTTRCCRGTCAGQPGVQRAAAASRCLPASGDGQGVSSYITRHTSHITSHTSHVTHHKSHVT